MEMLPLIALVVLPLLIALLVAVANVRRELRHLRRRIEGLEARVSARSASLPVPTPLPFEPQATAIPATPMVPAPIPAPPVSPPPPPVPVAAPTPHTTSAGGPKVSLEQLIGGVWLQNVGSVLLLVGVFLMILWGYHSGRFGPGVLVIAGALLGLTLAWRGDRVARTVPPFGHALIGVGLGVLYLTIYLGHVRLGVLPSWGAFALLVVTSFGSVLAGLHYRVRLIAVLGVIGAYLPLLMAAWLPLGGLWTSPPGLLAYLAIVNAFVLVMAAYAGWSGLDVAGILLGTVAWIWSFHAAQWGWGIQIGLAVLFTLFGLAPVPRLATIEGRVRPGDLAAIALAPLCLIAASWPFLVYASRLLVAAMLATLAVVQLLAALWVDSRRRERDLWRPLTAAAIVLLAGALERALGTERTAIAWCLEGLALVALGLTPRGGAWLRVWGTVVMVFGVMWHLSRLSVDDWTVLELPVLYFGGIRGMVVVISVLTGGWLLARRRDLLTEAERWAPEAWTAAGHLLLMSWVGYEARHLAAARFHNAEVLPTGVQKSLRVEELRLALCGTAWMAQAGAIVLLEPRRGSTFLRWCASGVAFFALVVVIGGFTREDSWALDLPPVMNLTSLLGIASVLIAIIASVSLAERRDRSGESTRWMPEIWAAGISLMLLLWTSREAFHIARATILPGADVSPQTWAQSRPVQTAAAAITSGAWILEATTLLVAGWVNRSPFLRWCGLVLFGLTVLKFIAIDLQSVEVFWRFVTAIAAGSAMLAISHLYRKRAQARD